MIGRCPHVCCFDRSNRYHVHACPPEECELCARTPAPKAGRLRSWWAALARRHGPSTATHVTDVFVTDVLGD